MLNSHTKLLITRDNGQIVEAQAPIIVSASRSTDIPGFYADWFLYRLKQGYSAWTNPFNGKRSYVSYKNTRLIVFWSKNPSPLLKEGGLLDYCEKKKINCYIQYSLNDYEIEGLEKGVPSLCDRIETFKRLVGKLGFGKIIWRFDPLILTDKISVGDLLRKIEKIGNQLNGFTEKLVFSFADISSYQRVKRNLCINNVKYKEFTADDMMFFASELQTLNKKWGYILATCGEKIDIEQYGIIHNRCIDDDLMIKYFSEDKILMDFLGVKIQNADLFHPEKTLIKTKNNKDKGQRLFCGCVMSKDIGEYNTCAHLCEYCYANTSKESALTNLQANRQSPFSETITGVN